MYSVYLQLSKTKKRKDGIYCDGVKFLGFETETFGNRGYSMVLDLLTDSKEFNTFIKAELDQINEASANNTKKAVA